MSKFKPKSPKDLNFKDIIYDKKDWIATISINRPEVYNAYSTLALQEMIQALEDASWDDGVAVVVITGVGDKAFCTGGDVKEYADEYTKRPRDYWKWMGLFMHCLDLMRNLGKPMIARINGMAVGGGNEINMACDLAIIAEHAYIRQVGVRVGSVACGGATQWLPIIVGDRRAREILYFCEEISAYKALEWGLVNKVVPSVKGSDGKYLNIKTLEEVNSALKNKENKIDFSALDSAINEYAQKLIEKFPECLRYTKQQVNYWKDQAWYSTIGHARDWLAIHYTSVEPYEGMTAFVEKRKPDYVGWRKKASEDKSSEFVWGPYTKTCSKCGTKGIPEEFEFCGKCGSKI
jgi:enoyl-CoA hydratase/carnithine racemase